MVSDVVVGGAIAGCGEGGEPGPAASIEQLAADGLLFRHTSTNPVCAPTRAAALTGRYGFRTGIGTPASALLMLRAALPRTSVVLYVFSDP